ncbi:MAG: MFS transporter [Klebsiella michiganensis]|nr:MFS transporter [Klebsiella michiganensis]
MTLSIATQALMNDLHATLGQVSTANTMYPLVAGTFMVAGGMLGCIWGWRMLFRIGCLIFILAEACAFFSPSIALFTWGARLTAGIGGSLMIPAVFGLISALYQQRRPRRLAHRVCLAWPAGAAYPALLRHHPGIRKQTRRYRLRYPGLSVRHPGAVPDDFRYSAHPGLGAGYALRPGSERSRPEPRPFRYSLRPDGAGDDAALGTSF